MLHNLLIWNSFLQKYSPFCKKWNGKENFVQIEVFLVIEEKSSFEFRKKRKGFLCEKKEWNIIHHVPFRFSKIPMTRKLVKLEKKECKTNSNIYCFPRVGLSFTRKDSQTKTYYHLLFFQRGLFLWKDLGLFLHWGTKIISWKILNDWLIIGANLQT